MVCVGACRALGRHMVLYCFLCILYVTVLDEFSHVLQCTTKKILEFALLSWPD